MLKQLQDRFLEELTPKIIPYGFKYRKGKRDYVRNFQHGKHAFHIAVINHTEDFDVTVDFAVRFDLVEDRLNEGRNLISEKEKRDTYTIGSEFGNWMDQNQRRWNFRTANDIEDNVIDILSFFSGPVLAFFDQFSSPDVVLETLIDETRGGRICPFDDVRKETIKIIKQTYFEQSVAHNGD